MGVLEEYVFRIKDFMIDEEEEVTAIAVMAIMEKVIGLGDGAMAVGTVIV